MQDILKHYLGENMDKSIRPQDDFFSYVNGGWIKNTEIPADQVKWGAFYILAEENKEKLRTILEDSETDNKLRDVYNSFMDEEKIESLGTAPLAQIFDKINSLSDAKSLTEFLALAEKRGVDTPFGFTVMQDDKKSDEVIITFFQSGLGLPDRDYYFKDDAEFEKIRNQYKIHVNNMLELAGVENAQAKAEGIYEFEKKLAQVSMTKVDARDIDKVYNKKTIGEIKALAPNIDWDLYWQSLNVPNISDTTEVLIYQPDVLHFTSNEFANTSIDIWKDYFTFHTLSAYAGYLPKKYVEESFRFYGKELSGAKEIKPRWKRAVNTVEGTLGYLLGEYFVKKYYGYSLIFLLFYSSCICRNIPTTSSLE